MELVKLKTCSECREVKETSLFHKDRHAPDGLCYACKTCIGKRNKASYLKNNRLEKKNHVDRYTRHNITKRQYEEMLEQQDHKCAICRSDNPGSRGTFRVDHDHRCCPGSYSCGKCIRGLLCDNCNRGIGFLKDNVDVVLSAASYLKDKNY